MQASAVDVTEVVSSALVYTWRCDMRRTIGLVMFLGVIFSTLVCKTTKDLGLIMSLGQKIGVYVLVAAVIGIICFFARIIVTATEPTN